VAFVARRPAVVQFADERGEPTSRRLLGAGAVEPDDDGLPVNRVERRYELLELKRRSVDLARQIGFGHDQLLSPHARCGGPDAELDALGSR
jgi:hypothetical protein